MLRGMAAMVSANDFRITVSCQNLILRRNQHKGSCNGVAQANFLSESANIEEWSGTVGSNLFLVFETIRLLEQQKDASARQTNEKGKSGDIK